jgi:NADPH-dependent 2,4-dienoyl-CoA reductase/sulfur reductase-like enzyme
MRVVVIGADATGASAASGIKRALRDQVEVIVLDRQAWTSYSACGIPFWIGGEVPGPEGLVARTPEQHRANGLDLRTGWEVTAIDPSARTVSATVLDSGAQEVLHYDHLVIATGATPLRPPIPGMDLPGVYGVQTLDDGLRVLDALADKPQTAVVVGAGYIGIEMAEAMSRQGLDVTIVDRAPEPMTSLDEDMGEWVSKGIREAGLAFHGGESVMRIDGDGRAQAVVTAAGTYPADIVILGLGVRPNTAFAQAAGLPVGDSGGLLTDDHQRVRGFDTIWAGGDCVEVLERVSGTTLNIPLGTHANKHGRVIAANIAGEDLTFPGVIGTAISGICGLEVSRTGLTEAKARELGLDPVSATINASTKVGYFPGVAGMRIKAVAQRGTGRVLGCQIVGGTGSGKRIDAIAVAIWNEMTVEDVTSLDLAYAPPFSPVWDPVQQVCRVLTKKV